MCGLAFCVNIGSTTFSRYTDIVFVVSSFRSVRLPACAMVAALRISTSSGVVDRFVSTVLGGKKLLITMSICEDWQIPQQQKRGINTSHFPVLQSDPIALSWASRRKQTPWRLKAITLEKHQRNGLPNISFIRASGQPYFVALYYRR